MMQLHSWKLLIVNIILQRFYLTRIFFFNFDEKGCLLKKWRKRVTTKIHFPDLFFLSFITSSNECQIFLKNLPATFNLSSKQKIEFHLSFSECFPQPEQNPTLNPLSRTAIKIKYSKISIIKSTQAYFKMQIFLSQNQWRNYLFTIRMRWSHSSRLASRCINPCFILIPLNTLIHYHHHHRSV